jgi:hypothetical protein
MSQPLFSSGHLLLFFMSYHLSPYIEQISELLAFAFKEIGHAFRTMLPHWQMVLTSV